MSRASTGLRNVFKQLRVTVLHVVAVLLQPAGWQLPSLLADLPPYADLPHLGARSVPSQLQLPQLACCHYCHTLHCAIRTGQFAARVTSKSACNHCCRMQEARGSLARHEASCSCVAHAKWLFGETWIAMQVGAI